MNATLNQSNYSLSPVCLPVPQPKKSTKRKSTKKVIFVKKCKGYLYHYGNEWDWAEGNPFTCVYKNKVTAEVRRGRDVTPSCQDCKDEYEMNCME